MKKVLLLFVALLTAGFALAEPETMSLRILATSDLHGKFMPWDYALNEESLSGSMTQLATAVKAHRTENTLLVDAGDTIQDNAADIFIHDEGPHPMVTAINAIGYDVWSVGNHEFNYGMDVVKKTVADIRAKALCGNVYDESGAPLADGCAVFDVDSVRVAVIGMVTPTIARTDADNLRDCTVTDPLEETRAIIDGLDGQYDVLVGVFHMGIDDEYGVPDSGVTDILDACPEFDVMVSSHEHRLIEGETIGGALVVQNKNQAQTLSVIDVTLERQGAGWQVTDKASQSVKIANYDPDPQITELLEPWHLRARADAETVIGRLEGGPLAPESAEGSVPAALVQDTALIDLINAAQLHYTDAAVSAAALNTPEANLYPGEIHKCDASLIYRYANALYVLRMTGAQLKGYMEWSANFYDQHQPGDDGTAFNPDVPNYNYYMFSGVNYQINIANPPGNRIERLTWPDGAPVADDDVFDLAVNNYCANAQLLTPGEIYAEGDAPELVASEVRGDIGGIRELIRDYIVNVKNGVITPECDNNWRITW